MRPPVLAILVLASSCAHHAPNTYRYVKQDTPPVLIPPGVADAAVTQRSFTFRTPASGGAKCSVTANGVAIRARKHELRVTVNRDSLLATQPGGLAVWTASLEKAGCLATGEGGIVASRIAESLPIDPAAANGLLHPDVLRGGYVDLGPHNRLKVVSPILREGAPKGASALETKTTAAGENKINVEVKTSSDFLGYEMAWWNLEARPGGGVRFAPGPAEAQIQGKSTQEARSRFDYFHFLPEAAYFRLFFLTRISTADHDIAILSARNATDLEEETKALNQNPAACGTAAMPMCILVPQEVAVVPHIVVTVNGKETPILAGSRLRGAILAGGEKNPAHVLATLSVDRFYAGVLTRVDFDRASPAILDLPLSGGERVAWSP